jgi:hypothetical protein
MLTWNCWRNISALFSTKGAGLSDWIKIRRPWTPCERLKPLATMYPEREMEGKGRTEMEREKETEREREEGREGGRERGRD